MNSVGPSFDPVHETRTLARAAALAFFVEFSILTIVGWRNHWIAHPAPNSESSFVEAQVFHMPTEAHLTEEKKTPSPPTRREAVMSKAPGVGKKSAPNEVKPQEENQTKSGPKLAPSHGPIAVYAPPPAIPGYLRDENLKASVVIDFLISAQGAATPRLVNSSGNEELDAIAISTAKQWQFRPAEKDHKAIDSKIRLRIVFEVK